MGAGDNKRVPRIRGQIGLGTDVEECPAIVWPADGEKD